MEYKDLLSCLDAGRNHAGQNGVPYFVYQQGCQFLVTSIEPLTGTPCIALHPDGTAEIIDFQPSDLPL